MFSVRTLVTDPHLYSRPVLFFYPPEAQVKHNSRKTCILFNQRERENRALRKEIVLFRQQQQQPWQRREFDLNDPDLYKKTNQDDAQMILPGLVGEDPDCKSRQQRQKDQLRDWLVQQQMQHEAERRQQILDGRRRPPLLSSPRRNASSRLLFFFVCDPDQLYHENKLKIHREILDLGHQEKERRRAVTVATKDYNLAQVCRHADAKNKMLLFVCVLVLNDGLLWKIEEKRHRKSASDDRVQEQPTAAAPDACVGVPGPCCCVDPRPEPEAIQHVTEIQKYQMEEKKVKQTPVRNAARR